MAGELVDTTANRGLAKPAGKPLADEEAEALVKQQTPERFEPIEIPQF